MTESKKKIDLPFKIVKSEVSGGYIDSVHTAFTGGIDIVNYHEEKYAHFDTKPLQSPFTERWVGGKSHRHVSLNTGSDNAQNRQEAWHTEFYADGVRFYSHKKLNSPPSYWTRDELAKRPVNIKNVSGTELYIGNYSKNYEVVQTTGRRITNNLIVDGFEANGPLTTQFVTGANDYQLPELNSITGSKSVFVERFNAPGSKEESSRGALDREGEEMSPNIPLPFRSIKIRQPFYRQLTQHSPQFGSGSTYALLPATGSVDAVTIHKINRNRLARGDKEHFDNGFVTHAIPRTDIQYSWITASSPVSASELGGYQSFAGNYNRSEAYTDILFNSGSLVISGSSTQYFVDNFGIKSLVKNTKKIDIEAKLFSMSSSISASFSEYTNNPYTFTTWTSLRTAEHPVAKSLKKNNIVAVQKEAKEKTLTTRTGRRIVLKPRRNQESQNFTEPPITVKYRPLKHRFVFKNAESEDSAHELEHTYANIFSTFSNKALIERLSIPEQKETFYNLIYEYYTNPNEQDNNPIDKFLGYTYTERVWPKEENTGLNKTRKRAEYFLNKSGFTRDGFDRQLGTQRVFWRNEQQDRKRSKNSEGGYYSSINYLSTEETGSNFVQSETGVLSNNKIFSFDFNFVQDSGIDEGLFNSISLLENSSSERNLLRYSGSADSQWLNVTIPVDSNYGKINKKGYVFDVSGEFNNSYTDFYEQIKNDNEANKKSLGAMYRNTSYKSLLTAMPEERSQYEDLAVKTEDEAIFANPKLKYVSFIGGGELNTGSYVQNPNLFSEDYSSAEGIGPSGLNSLSASAMATTEQFVYFAGRFSVAGDTSALNVAKFDHQNKKWYQLGDGIGGAATSIVISGSDVYVGGNLNLNGTNCGVAKWSEDTETWSILNSALGSGVQSLIFSGSDLYAGGSFTNVGSNPSANRIVKWNGSSWDAVGTGFSSGVVSALAIYSGQLVAAGSTPSRIYYFDGVSWNALGGGLSNPVLSLLENGTDLYAGDASGNVYKYDSVLWSVEFSVSDDVYAIAISGSDIYVGGSFTVSGIRNIAVYDGASVAAVGSGLDSATNSVVKDIKVINSEVYACGRFFTTGTCLSIWDPNGAEFTEVRSDPGYNIFSEQYFDQNFNQSVFSFSTLDNGLLRKTEEQSGKKPFYDSYEDFIEDVRGEAKDYSVLSEFRISEHMNYYVSTNGGNFRAQNRKLFTLDGANKYVSAQSEKSFYDQEFLKTYSTSDILKKHDEIKKENENISDLEKINIKISGIKKLLPYSGFYPQDRTTQLTNLYSDYVENNLHGGVYNLSYRNDFYNSQVVNTAQTSQFNTIAVAEYNNIYYAAVGYFDLSTSGRVRIYSSSAGDPINWNSGYTELTPPSSVIGNSLTDFGKKVIFVSASNGLNLFISSGRGTSLSDTRGYMFSSAMQADGTWPDPSLLAVAGTSPTQYISGSSGGGEFGKFYDIAYENNNGAEKILMAIGARNEGGTFQGNVYVVTGTLANNEWQWSNKSLIFTGSPNNFAGTGISIISCSSGYQVLTGETLGDLPSSGLGNIWALTSSDGLTWSSGVVISSGSNVFSSPGFNDIKAADFNNKTYVFFSEYGSDIKQRNENGAIFCVTSSASNQWPSVNTYLDKKLVYYTPLDNDENAEDSLSYSISIFSGSDSRLYYGFANSNANNLGISEFATGYTDADNNWQTTDEQNLLILQQTNNSYETVTVSSYSIGGYNLPIFFTSVQSGSNRNIAAIKNNIFTEYVLKVSGSEKYYKHAALEPFFAPGILYNTIKSGLAVDWPCATGSNTAIVPYGGNTIVNAYYPKSFEMANHSGSSVYESMYGQVRSNIDYRIPFENILFPNEAFKEKKYQETDLISRTVLTTLEDNDPLVQFIDKTYIYGGYEPYISPIDFSDINNLGPKRFSVPFVYRKEGATDTGLYTLAMSNFLAETVKFFLKDEKMVTFSSQPDYKWKQFDSNKTYYMDIILEKSPDLIMMEAYHSNLHPTGSNGEKMNGRYFGYPVNKTDKALWGGAEFTEEERRLIHNDPAYAPYTPPYFEGIAKVRVAFKPTGTNRAYTVQEVFDEATIENIFDDVALGATTGSDAYLNKMPIGSSFEIFGAAQATEVTIDEVTGQQTVRELTDTQNWIISPRLETPVLNFSSQSLEPYQNNYSKTSGFGRGMWSGYGMVPEEGKAIKVRLAYPYSQEQVSPLTASLLEQVGFKAEEKNVGVIADNKTISEAVVMIPYLDTRYAGYTTESKTGFNFIKISKPLMKKVREGKQESESITDMIEKMEKYVIPPEMNFLQYNDIHPFVMYLFEFEHVLTQQDLADIWQGVMPSISETAEKDEVTISHNSGEFEFFEGKKLPDNLKWLVFKVKKKAEKNYFNVTATTKDDARFDFNKIIGREVGTDVYSYNWPYDFFSLVEFAKVELKLDYKAKETEE